MASFSPTHSSLPRPEPTVLPTDQASPHPLQTNQASATPATVKVEVKRQSVSPTLGRDDWNLGLCTAAPGVA